MKDFIEQRVLGAIRGLLAGRVNELLGNLQYAIPLIEFGIYNGGAVIVPDVVLTSCERTEKERVIRQDAYSMTITFNVPETPESELYCYAYSGALGRAIYEDRTLGGVVDRAVITGKKYKKPKTTQCGENWEMEIMLRITVEGVGNRE